MPASRRTPYQELVDASKHYLGPAGERFVRRQITTHLEKQPELIRREDVENIIKWIRPAFALITNNRQYLDEYMNKLYTIAQKQEQQSSKS